uniref:Uncharacterized protein n=1 Tax=Meloidogyne floridensis TaxID=298350 RepID=A0A915P0R2_9BILA
MRRVLNSTKLKNTSSVNTLSTLFIIRNQSRVASSPLQIIKDENNSLKIQKLALKNNNINIRQINSDCFSDRHNGPCELEKQQMLRYLGFKANI